ncbi:phospholipid-binding protein [candidate division KSB3 bacterium]|uniref:Phospholipid-binding protein n=1 Tax=candidate division KSB3 bacterium TaxID=2044937 RepID=A0A9D5JXZ8_9BACT|nr:phospholipid-binding protein [candidate division KSB3 bacterium]MBD3326031.1 phospholipid-binding protein [candidate division KSB3 bacterium]
MAIITISRQVGSFGTEIGKQLQTDLHYNYFDKHSLETELFKTCGISEKKLEKYDEKRPTFWETFSADKEKYHHCIKTMLYRFARQSHCIIIGRGGQALFQGLSGVLHVRVIAPPELRKERIKARFHYDDHLAEQTLHHSDQDRSGFHRYFFQINWDDPRLYHLTLSTDLFSVEAAAQVIKDAVEATGIQAQHPDKDPQLANRSLTQEIITHIKYKEHIPVQFLDVIVADGSIILKGATTTEDNIKRCETIAYEVFGAQKVSNEIRYVHHPYSLT